MFNVGGGEFLVILLVALIVLGPQRLPGAVRQAGQFMGELRKMSSGFQRELKSAFDEAEAADRKAPPASATLAGEAGTPGERPDGSAAAAEAVEPVRDLPGDLPGDGYTEIQD